MSIPWYHALVSVLPVMVTTPVRLTSVPVPVVLKPIFDESTTVWPVPELSTLLLVMVTPSTPVPLMPLAVVLRTAIRSKEGLLVDVSEIPTVAFCMAPPVQVAALVQVPPAPVTVRLPLVPVPLSRIPLAAPL